MYSKRAEPPLCLRVRNGGLSLIADARLCGNSWLACARWGWMWLLVFMDRS